jgi:hypothetical protein
MVLLLLLLLCGPVWTARGYQEEYPASTLSHQTGRAVGDAWVTTVQDREDAFMSYGPYATDIPPLSPIVVEVVLSIDNNDHDGAQVRGNKIDIRLLAIDVLRKSL